VYREVSLADEGEYVCRASNEGGHTEQHAQLIIHSQSTLPFYIHSLILFLLGGSSRMSLFIEFMTVTYSSVDKTSSK